MAILQIPQAIVPAAFGSQTLLSTTSLSGATTTISSIPQTYKDLKIIVRLTTVSGRLKFRVNGSDSLSTTRIFYGTAGISNSVDGATTQDDQTNPNGFLYLYDYANTSYSKQGHFMGTSSGVAYSGGTFNYNSTSAVTSIGIHFNGNSPSAGSVLIYGVN
jgi:hypothetical protein